ncbi:type II toxin-antitoxin system YafQ family toxin [Lactobacillus helsingborgensis]
MKKLWSEYHEFHVLNDLLVIYYQVDAKKHIRMVTITNHKELSTGKL